MRPAVFLDRDGVLIPDMDPLTRCDQIELFSYAPEAVDRLRAAGLMVVVVTNQPVVARGLVSEADVVQAHQKIQELLGMSGGGPIDRFYFCPHHPDATLPEYRVDCECRKPRPGMLLSAARDLNVDLGASYLVGDRPSDIAAGQRAGCKTILVETGMHLARPIYVSDPAELDARPDFICGDLGEAVDFILGPAE